MIIRQICVRHGRSLSGLCAINRSQTDCVKSGRTALRSSTRCQAQQRDPSQQPQRRQYASRSVTTSPQRTLADPTDANQPTSSKSIPGHPNQASSILDTSQHASTGRTRQIEHQIDEFEEATRSIQADVSAHTMAKLFSSHQEIPGTQTTDLTKEEEKTMRKASSTSQSQDPNQKSVLGIPYANLYQYNQNRRNLQQQERKGTQLSETYNPKTLLQNAPTPSQVTLSMLLANQTHLGHATALWNPANSQYIFGIRDGIHIISLDATYAYLQRAAKIVQAVARNGGMILFVGTRKGQEDIVIRAASRGKGYHIYDRWTPGTLTNGQQILGDCALKVVDLNDDELPDFKAALTGSAALRPDLVVVFNPIENEVCLHECGIYNVPTIGIVDTDANPSWVTYPIPANDDSRRSVALIAGVLSRAAEQGQTERLDIAKNGKVTYETASVRKMLMTWKKDVDRAATGNEARKDAGPPAVGARGTGAGGVADTGGVGMMAAVTESGMEEVNRLNL